MKEIEELQVEIEDLRIKERLLSSGPKKDAITTHKRVLIDTIEYLENKL